MKYDIKKIAWIDCIFAPMQDANSVTIEIMCKAGNNYETRETNGMSHFLEHMFFKWGKKYPTPKDVAEAVDTFGGEFNAFTGDEYAGYYVKCAPDFTDKAIDVLGDMMISAQFPLEELEREKGVVIQEIKMYEDNPMALVMDKRQTFFYGDNPYGWTTLGPVKNIQSFTQEMLFTHKNQLYTKDNLIIIIAGNIKNQQAIEEQLADLFGPLPDVKTFSKTPFTRILPATPQDHFSKKTEQNHLVISADGFGGRSPQRYAANVLATLLGGNMSSRLFQNIREKEGLCYYIRATHSSNEDFGAFVIRAGIEKGRFEFGIKRIYEEIAAIAEGNFSEEEFHNAIWYTEGQLQMGIESSDEMANFIWAQYLLYGKIETLEDILSAYKSLTRADIQAIAQQLASQRLYLYWIE